MITKGQDLLKCISFLCLQINEAKKEGEAQNLFHSIRHLTCVLEGQIDFPEYIMIRMICAKALVNLYELENSSRITHSFSFNSIQFIRNSILNTLEGLSEFETVADDWFELRHYITTVILLNNSDKKESLKEVDCLKTDLKVEAIVEHYEFVRQVLCSESEKDEKDVAKFRKSYALAKFAFNLRDRISNILKKVGPSKEHSKIPFVNETPPIVDLELDVDCNTNYASKSVCCKLFERLFNVDDMENNLEAEDFQVSLKEALNADVGGDGSGGKKRGNINNNNTNTTEEEEKEQVRIIKRSKIQNDDDNDNYNDNDNDNDNSNDNHDYSEEEYPTVKKKRAGKRLDENIKNKIYNKSPSNNVIETEHKSTQRSSTQENDDFDNNANNVGDDDDDSDNVIPSPTTKENSHNNDNDSEDDVITIDDTAVDDDNNSNNNISNRTVFKKLRSTGNANWINKNNNNNNHTSSSNNNNKTNKTTKATSIVKAGVKKKTWKRNKWTNNEVRALIDGIKAFQIGRWADIMVYLHKKGLLTDRDAPNLKDKWRVLQKDPTIVAEVADHFRKCAKEKVVEEENFNNSQ
eukprot:Pgem_evm1s498